MMRASGKKRLARSGRFVRREGIDGIKRIKRGKAGIQASPGAGEGALPSRAFIALIALSLLSLASLAPFASARQAPPADAGAVLKRFFHEVRQLKADFTQLEFDGDGVLRKESAGRLYLSRPGRFRLDYLQPDELLIWANGKTLSVFDKELEQVTVYRQTEQLKESAAALLAGEESVLENYEVSAAEFEDGLQWFNLASADAEQGSLRLALRGSVPAALEYSDELGSRVRLLLSRLDFDSELDGKLFDPDIPAGVDIFEAAES